MKFLSSRGFRLGALALATQMLLSVPLAPALAQGTDSTMRRREPVTLNFQNADIESIARTMAVISGRDVVLDPRVKGTMTLVTDRPVAPTAALNQFAAALRLQNYAIVEADGLYKIVPEAEAKLQSSTVAVSTGAAGVGGNQVVTQVFKLNHESAGTLLPVLRPLIAPNNTISANPGNNSLVITDYAENLRRIARIVAALDVPNASDVEVIPLRHSIASDLAPLVTRLVEGGSGSGAPGTPAQAGDASYRTSILADPRSNSLIVRAANPVRVQLVRSLVAKLDRPPLDNGNGDAGNIYVVYLKNADAVRLAATLRAAIASDAQLRAASNNPAAGGLTGAAAASSGQATSGLGAILGLTDASGAEGSPATSPVNNANMPSTGGQIQADPSTNSLIITASEPQYRQLRAVIEKLDGRRAQVLVECLIAEVNADKAAEFGIQWQAPLGNSSNHNVGVIGTNSSLAGTNIINMAIAAATKDPTKAMPASGFNFGIGTKVGGQYVLAFLARFLEGNNEGNVLSTPNLLTLDNEEAKIVIGQNVPFITGQYTNAGLGTNTVNPFQTYERKDVGLTLRVRPQINENNTVKLTLYQEVSTIAANSISSPSGPITNKRSIESSVMVDDGAIVVLGGLLQDDYSSGVEKVPLLGDIPLLGNLFKSEKRSRKKTNLMVFLRPVVIRDNATSDALTYDRYDALRSLQQAAQPDSQNIMLRAVPDSNILPALPAPDPGADRSIEGTRLVPPPLSTEDMRALGARQTVPSPLRGALPPTADPASARELP